MTGSRASGEDLMRALAAGFAPERGVTEDRMFNGRGLKAAGAFFAFVNSRGELVVKLSESSVRKLVADGEASPVTMGRRTMREWASLPRSEADTTAWRAALEAAYAFALSRTTGTRD